MKTQSQKYPQVFLYGKSIFNLIPNDITPIIQRFWGSALTMDQLSAEEKQSKNHRVDDAYQLHPRNFSDRYQEWCFGKMVSPFKYTYFEYLLNVKFWGCKKKSFCEPWWKIFLDGIAIIASSLAATVGIPSAARFFLPPWSWREVRYGIKPPWK